MGRRRTINPTLPKNLYCANGYYSWRDPETRETFGIGRDRQQALAYATAIIRKRTMEMRLHPLRNRLSDRMARGESVLLSPREISLTAIPVRRRQSGVYFLLHDNEIVYVGQTTDWGARLAAHMRDQAKIFNRCAFQECDDVLLDELEATYIERLQPKFNRARYPHLANIEEMLVSIQYRIGGRWDLDGMSKETANPLNEKATS